MALLDNTDDLFVTPEEQDLARKKKLGVNALLGATDSLRNAQSFGEIYLGRPQKNYDSSAYAKQMDEAIDQPIADKQARLKQAIQEPEVNNLHALMDRNSPQSAGERQQAKMAVSVLKANPYFKDKPEMQKVFDNYSNSFDQMHGYDIKKNVESSPLLKQAFQDAAAMTRAQMMAQLAGAKLEESKNQHSAEAGNSWEKDGILTQAKKNWASLDRAVGILNNPSKPVTAKDLNLAYNDYINAVDVAGQATEGKIHRELPEIWAVQFNDLKAKAGDFDDLRQSKSGAALIDLLQKNMAQVKKDLGNAMADQSNKRATNYSANTNPKVQQVVKQKQAEYNKYREDAEKPPVQGDTVNMIGPDGKIKAIPKSQVEAALAAGGKLAK